MRKTALKIFSITILQIFFLQFSYSQGKTIDQKVDSVLKLMNLDEKIGQLNQYNDDWLATGPVTIDSTKADQIKSGKLGSLLNCMSTARIRKWQEIAMQSRLKIPLIFGQDVIHGYKTTFPIPLAESCSWDLDAIELSARVSATEASAAGLNWTFAPMVDGEEIVQLYLRDLVSSIARPVQELKDFKKIKIQAGKSETIKFLIDKEKLSFFNQQLQWVAEPGEFEVMIGASSRDIRLKASFEMEE
jgi:hypothetical protein